MAAALVAGIVLRTIALDAAPAGLHHDEACNGYDAYSILHTGRDHHGNFMPIAIEAFGDYRPPIFDFLFVPLISSFGLKPVVVRLGAGLGWVWLWSGAWECRKSRSSGMPRGLSWTACYSPATIAVTYVDITLVGANVQWPSVPREPGALDTTSHSIVAFTRNANVAFRSGWSKQA